MRITIQTHINLNFKEAFKRFDLKLFEALSPPVGNLKVTRFDGCKKGDEVHVKILGSEWISHITDFKETDTEIYFIDEGFKLPPPLKTWKHTHRIEKVDANHSLVIDDIHFSTGNSLLDKLLYPALYATFSLRGPVYKRELS